MRFARRVPSFPENGVSWLYRFPLAHWKLGCEV